MLDIGEVLGAEAAADIGRDEADAARIDGQRAGHEGAIDVNVLAGDVQRVAAGGRVERSHGAARLHRVRDHAVIAEGERHDVSGSAEGLVHGHAVTGLPIEAGIAGNVRGKLGRVGGTRRFGRGDGGQRVVVDDDQLGGIEGLGARLGHDQRDRLAHEADFVGGEQGLRDEGERLAGLGVGLAIGAERLQAVGVDVGCGQYDQHARCVSCSLDLDGPDARMAVWRPQHDGMRQSVESEIVEIGAVPGDEALILATPGGLTDSVDSAHTLLPRLCAVVFTHRSYVLSRVAGEIPWGDGRASVRLVVGSSKQTET